MPITERVEPRVYYINTKKMPLHTRVLNALCFFNSLLIIIICMCIMHTRRYFLCTLAYAEIVVCRVDGRRAHRTPSSSHQHNPNSFALPHIFCRSQHLWWRIENEILRLRSPCLSLGRTAWREKGREENETTYILINKCTGSGFACRIKWMNDTENENRMENGLIFEAMKRSGFYFERSRRAHTLCTQFWMTLTLAHSISHQIKYVLQSFVRDAEKYIASAITITINTHAMRSNESRAYEWLFEKCTNRTRLKCKTQNWKIGLHNAESKQRASHSLEWKSKALFATIEHAAISRYAKNSCKHSHSFNFKWHTSHGNALLS